LCHHTQQGHHGEQKTKADGKKAVSKASGQRLGVDLLPQRPQRLRSVMVGMSASTIPASCSARVIARTKGGGSVEVRSLLRSMSTALLI
jgi:hypothetical protein